MSLNSYDKPKWRAQHLRFMKRPAIFEAGKFKCSILMLAGDSGYKFYDQLRPHLESPAQLIAIDNSIDVVGRNILDNHNQTDPWAWRVFHGDFWRLAALVSDTRPPLGVFDFDGTELVKGAFWRDHAGDLRHLVTKSLDAGLREVVLMVNLTLDRPMESGEPGVMRLKRFRAYVTGLVETFQSFDPSLSEETLIDDNLREILTEGWNWTGQLGAFQIYKSGDHVLRMATVRMAIRKNSIEFDTGLV